MERIVKAKGYSAISAGALIRYFSAAETEINRAQQAGKVDRALNISTALVKVMSDQDVYKRAHVKDYAIRNHRAYIATVDLIRGDPDAAIRALSLGSLIEPGMLETRIAYRKAVESGDVPFRVLHAFALGAPFPQTPDRDSLTFAIEHAGACLKRVSEEIGQSVRPTPVTQIDGVDLFDVIALLDHQTSGIANRDHHSKNPAGGFTSLKTGYETLITLYQGSGDFNNAASTEDAMHRVLAGGRP